MVNSEPHKLHGKAIAQGDRGVAVALDVLEYGAIIRAELATAARASVNRGPTVVLRHQHKDAFTVTYVFPHTCIAWPQPLYRIWARAKLLVSLHLWMECGNKIG